MIAKLVQFLPKSLIIIYLSLSLVGCGSKINQENYDKIENGMTVTAVKEILGEPTDSNTGSFSIPVLGSVSGTEAVWKDEENAVTITITFVNDKVKFKTYKGQ